ncbi:MAG: MFS transporter [Anaerolineae bacterium]|nr:MFS transporter [Anaerolineae bacterium]
MRAATNFKTIRTHPLVIPLYVPSLLYAFCIGLLIPILPLYAADFDISYSLVGVVLAAELLGVTIADVPAGMLVQRFGIKRVMVAGLSIIIVTTGSLFWAQSVLLVIVLRLLGGMGLALFNITRHTYLADTVTIERRGRLIALFGGLRRAGTFAGPAVGGIVSAHYGLRAPFLLHMAISIVALGIILVYLEDRKVKIDVGGHRISIGNTLKTNYRALLSGGSGYLFAQMIRYGRNILIPLYGADILGLSTQDIGFIVSIASAIDMMLFYPAGWIMDKKGRKYAIVPSFLGQGIGIALIPFSLSAWGLLAAACVVGFANGLGSGSMMTLSSDLAPEGKRGEFLGVWNLIGDAGSAGSPLIVGTVADLLALQPAAWAIAIAGFLAAGLFAFFVPETLKKQE